MTIDKITKCLLFKCLPSDLAKEKYLDVDLIVEFLNAVKEREELMKDG